MKIDLSQFEGLELENMADWPKPAKILLMIFIAAVVTVLGYQMLISDRIKTLDAAQAKEVELKDQFRVKYHVAANLDLFRAQMQEAEEMFSQQLKSLPESHETPGLLDDITFVGTTSELNFNKLDWKPEIARDLYIELPIAIEVEGSYHSFGQFVSKIAGLPRIVTIHDFAIERSRGDERALVLKLQAKTYRYKEQG